MSENDILQEALPEPQDNDTDRTTPTEQEIFVPIKFNKQILNLDFKKAQELAQKGMKFDLIANDYEALKNLARAENLSVREFISTIERQKNNNRQSEILGKCGDDTEFAEYVMKLEKGQMQEVKGFTELKDNFPQIEKIEDLPESVLEAAKMKGTLLLDEYLRYLHTQDTLMKNSIKNQKEAQSSAMGPMVSKKGTESPETAEFLRGLWQK